MSSILSILWLTYWLWGSALILFTLNAGAEYSSRQLPLALAYIPLSALLAAAVAAPTIVGTEGFALPGPWWLGILYKQRNAPSFMLGTFQTTVIVFAVLALVILLCKLGYRAFVAGRKS